MNYTTDDAKAEENFILVANCTVLAYLTLACGFFSGYKKTRCMNFIRIFYANPSFPLTSASGCQSPGLCIILADKNINMDFQKVSAIVIV